MTFLRDFLLAFRSLNRDRPTLVGSVLCLALGIGGSVPLLSALDRLYFQPPEGVSDPGSLRRLAFQERTGQVSSSTSYPNLIDLRKGISEVSGLSGFFALEMPVGVGDRARKVRTAFVARDYFSMLGVSPQVGRAFTAEETAAKTPHAVALVGEGFWKRAGGGNEALGQDVWIGGEPYSIVGVVPQEFSGLDLQPVEVWLPVNAAELLLGPGWQTGRGSSFLEVVARVKPGSERAMEEQATAVLRRAWEAEGEPRPDLRVQVESLRPSLGAASSPAARLPVWLAGLSLIVLVIACANVAQLLLVRTLRRRDEIAVRRALGAGRGRLVRFLLTEALVLAVLGGAAAWWVSFAVQRSLQAAVLPAGAEPAGPDLRGLVVLLSLTVGSGVLCGLAPALRLLRDDRFSGFLAGRSTEKTPAALRSALLVGQVALTFVLAVGAGLFLASFRKAASLDLGLDVDRVLLATVDSDSAGLAPARQIGIYEAALERVANLPGVERVSLAAQVPFQSSFGAEITVPGRELPVSPEGGPYLNAVSEGFFQTLGTRLLQGRSFTAEDRRGAPPVVMINASFARLVWPDRAPLGQCVKFDKETGAPCATVVGVVEDARRSRLRENAALQVYVPLSQAPSSQPARALFARFSGDPGILIASVRNAFPKGGATPVFVDVRPLAELLEPQLRPWRTGSTLFALFGFLALGLAGVGIHASLSQAVAQKRREIGIRVALGAGRGRVLRLIGGQTVGVAVTGLAVGWSLALFGGRFLQPLLFEVKAGSLEVLVGATGMILAMAVLAGWLPGRRALRVDPASSLRESARPE